MESWVRFPAAPLPLLDGKLEAFRLFPMARYRIVRRSSFAVAGVPIFQVEERYWFWWEPRGFFESLADAELRVADLIAASSIKREVVKEYS